MSTSADHVVVMTSNKMPIAAMSIVFLIGTVLFWELDPPEDQIAFFVTLSVAAVSLGAVLGYRCQRLGNVSLSAVAYPISWRVGCVWIVLSAMVEFALTDGTISFTVDVLAPYIFISTGAIATFVLAGWIARRIVVAASRLAGWVVGRIMGALRTLTRSEWLQLIAVLLAAAALVVAIYTLQAMDLPQKPDVSSGR